MEWIDDTDKHLDNNACAQAEMVAVLLRQKDVDKAKETYDHLVMSCQGILDLLREYDKANEDKQTFYF